MSKLIAAMNGFSTQKSQRHKNTQTPVKVAVDEHVVVETVLSSKGEATYQTHKWFDPL